MVSGCCYSFHSSLLTTASPLDSIASDREGGPGVLAFGLFGLLGISPNLGGRKFLEFEHTLTSIAFQNDHNSRSKVVMSSVAEKPRNAYLGQGGMKKYG